MICPQGLNLVCGFDPVRLEPNNVGSIGPAAFGVTTDAVGVQIGCGFVELKGGVTGRARLPFAS